MSAPARKRGFARGRFLHFANSPKSAIAARREIV